MSEIVVDTDSSIEPTDSQRQRAQRARRIDTVLGWTVLVLAMALLIGGAWFGYSMWTDKLSRDAANPAIRVVRAVEAEVRQSPNSVELRVRLGEAYAGAGWYDKAITSFRQALKIDPEHTGAYLDIGKTMMIQGEMKTAEDAFQKVVDLSAGSEFEGLDARREEALFYMGQIAITEARYEDAIRLFKGALRIRRDASDTYLNLAIAYKNLDELDAAVDNISIALQLDPRFAPAHFALGEIYRDQGKMPSAAVEFRFALDIEPENEQYIEALAAFGSVEEYIAAARQALDKKEIQQALDAATTAKALAPTNIDAVLLYADALDASGRGSLALEAYRSALELDPKDERIQAAIARLEKVSN